MVERILEELRRILLARGKRERMVVVAMEVLAHVQWNAD